MFPPRRWLSIALTSLVLVSGTLLAAPRSAGATTGPSNYLPRSKYKVAAAERALYTGQYLFTSASSGARLTGGALGIEVSDTGYLYGVAQFYGYDAAGSRTVWTATLYNFHQANKLMAIDLLGPTGTPHLGDMYLRRSAHGALMGKIALLTGKWNISWRKISGR